MILESAQSLFAAAGYANASAEDVARGAGVAPSAIYRHFASKRALYLAALRDSGTRLLSIWKNAAGESADPLQTIWQLGLDYYDHVQSRSTFAPLWFQALGDASDPEVRGAIAANHTAMVDHLTGLIAAGQARGIVRAALDPRIAAWHFLAIGLTFDLLNHLGLNDELDREKVEAWGRLYIDSIREDAHGAGHIKHGEPGGALPVRQPRGESHPRGGGDPLSAMPANPSHPLGTERSGGPDS